MSPLVRSVLVKSVLVRSALSTMLVCRPPSSGTLVEGHTPGVGAAISRTLILIRARRSVEVTKTDRETLECGAMVKSILVSGSGQPPEGICWKDAFPPGGWLSIIIVKLLASLQVFFTT